MTRSFHIAPPALRPPHSTLRAALRTPPPALALLLACSLLLSSCGSGNQRATTSDGRVPVRVFLLLISTKQVGYYRWAEQTYEAEHPDVDIIIEQFPGSSLKDFGIKLRLRFSSKKAPDVFFAEEMVIAEYARLGLLAPAPSYIERMVEENSINEMARRAPYIDDICYGITNASVWTVLYYNKEMLVMPSRLTRRSIPMSISSSNNFQGVR